jgi:hypothetical protein
VRRRPAAAAGRSAPSRTFNDVIAPYSPALRRLARRARAWMKEQLPKSMESVDSRGPYVSYGYGPGYKGIVAYLTISKSGVKVGIAYGRSVPDPHHLLEGEGKSARHVVIRTAEDLEVAGLAPLFAAGLAAWKKDNA